jgi:hypothetical protein
MRKKRNVRRVMGWLLSFQLRDPGEGVCWAVSIWSDLDGGEWMVVDLLRSGYNSYCCLLHVASASAQERAPASRRFQREELWPLPPSRTS